MSTEKDFVEKALQTAIPEVVESLKKQLICSLDYEIQKAAEKQIVEYVTEWIKENLIPVLGSRLVKLNETFEEQAKEFVTKMSQTIFDELSAAYKKKMECSWNRESIFKAMFG